MLKRMVVLSVLAAMLTAGSVNAAPDAGRGGLMGFVAGCCFGPRAAIAYNDGKEIHWREWCRIIPYIGLVFAVWDGIDGANGVTTAEFADQYGSMFY